MSETQTATKVSKMEELLAKSEFLPKKLTRGQVVDGIVVSKSRDGMLVDISAKAEAVISGKDLPLDYDNIKVGDTVSAVVISSEGESGQAMLSMRKVGGELRWKQLNEKMNSGESVEVKGIEANRGGLIVETDGLRGFIPSSHLLSGANGSIGKTIEVKVIEVDKKMNRLVFSEREAHPEEAKLPKMELTFKEGDELDGKVSKVLAFGILVSLPGEVEGLVHISEISWDRVEKIESMFKVADSVKVKVISIDPYSGKVNLSIKKLQSDPWKEAAKKYPVGKDIEAEISRTSSYGAFVQLEQGIEGLIHSSKIPYGRKLEVGEKVKISIDLFNPDQHRVALRLAGEEQPEEEPKKKTKKTKKLEG
ncbi:MAG TPA: S1 RNA-binding domain-containing protein [Candidatus Saccharimonadales bacterium]|nr:S1 RNA-binding domain-containing protein [Candidatus Saccharimonadales bacterium]